MSDGRVGLTRDEMAQRCALDIPDGAYVNLGIGIPELVAAHVPQGREFIYHTENGLLGMGGEHSAGQHRRHGGVHGLTRYIADRHAE